MTLNCSTTEYLKDTATQHWYSLIGTFSSQGWILCTVRHSVLDGEIHPSRLAMSWMMSSYYWVICGTHPEKRFRRAWYLLTCRFSHLEPRNPCRNNIGERWLKSKCLLSGSLGLCTSNAKCTLEAAVLVVAVYVCSVCCLYAFNNCLKCLYVLGRYQAGLGRGQTLLSIAWQLDASSSPLLDDSWRWWVLFPNLFQIDSFWIIVP